MNMKYYHKVNAMLDFRGVLLHKNDTHTYIVMASIYRAGVYGCNLNRAAFHENSVSVICYDNNSRDIVYQACLVPNDTLAYLEMICLDKRAWKFVKSSSF